MSGKGIFEMMGYFFFSGSRTCSMIPAPCLMTIR